MVKCIKCEREHDGSFGSGRYCSRKCANSRQRSEVFKRELSVKMSGREGLRREKWSRERKENFEKSREKAKNTWEKKLLNESFDKLSFERLAKRVKLEQKEKCNRCGLSEWQGEKIVLELEHKDGNRNNNERENLECLCPNCHSLTATWRGRNCKKHFRVSDEDLLAALIGHNNNIRRALIKVGLTPKGGNYKRAYRIIKMSSGS